MKAFNNIYYDLFDEFTKEPVVFKLVTEWLDGSPMSDAKCDGVVYRKRMSVGQVQYLQRVLEDGKIYLEWYGIKADGVTDNSAKLKQVTEFFTQRVTFVLPHGTTYTGQTWEFKDRPHRVEGHPLGSSLLVAAGRMGIGATRTTSSLGPSLQGFSIIAAGQDPSDGRLPPGQYPNATYGLGNPATNTLPGFYTKEPALDPNAPYPSPIWPQGSYWTDEHGKHYPVQSSLAYSASWGAYLFHGIQVQAITRMTDMVVSGFSGRGLSLYGDVYNTVDGSAGFDCSRSYFENVAVSGCTFGITVDGTDANQCTFLSCDIRDNRVWGVQDNSFLGNHYLHCHANHNRFGHYCTTNINNRGTFEGCYGESGNDEGTDRPSRWTGFTSVYGGIHASGYLADNNVLVQEGNFSPTYRTNRLDVTDRIKLGQDVKFELGVLQYPGAGAGWGLGLGDYQQDLLQFFVPNTTFPIYEDELRERKRSVMGVNINNPYLNGRMVGAIGDIRSVYQSPQHRYFSVAFHAGDVLENTSFNGVGPTGWRCIRNGQQRAAYTEGLTVTWLGGTFYELSGISTVLEAGDAIEFGGDSMTINNWQDEAQYGRKRFLGAYPIQSQKDGGNMTIAFAMPRFRAEGNGIGLFIYRPAAPFLRTDDQGWRYYATDTETWYTWTGSGWIVG